MSIFKDMVHEDITAVFMNTDELAYMRDVGGVKMRVMQDDDRILDRSDSAAIGTGIGEGLIFVRAEDLPRIPAPNELLPIDGKNWYVVNAIENRGMYEIRLSRNQLQPQTGNEAGNTYGY